VQHPPGRLDRARDDHRGPPSGSSRPGTKGAPLREGGVRRSPGDWRVRTPPGVTVAVHPLAVRIPEPTESERPRNPVVTFPAEPRRRRLTPPSRPGTRLCHHSPPHRCPPPFDRDSSSGRWGPLAGKTASGYPGTCAPTSMRRWKPNPPPFPAVPRRTSSVSEAAAPPRHSESTTTPSCESARSRSRRRRNDTIICASLVPGSRPVP